MGVKAGGGGDAFPKTWTGPSFSFIVSILPAWTTATHIIPAYKCV